MGKLPPVYGFLVISGWHGTSATRVIVTDMTPKKFRIRAIARTKLAGRNRWLDQGQEALVPKTAVRIQATSELPPTTPKESPNADPS